MRVAAGVHWPQRPRVREAGRRSRALQAFRTSCPVVVRRQDQSGLTQPADWAALCAEAQASHPRMRAGLLPRSFRLGAASATEGFATGYYEPEIAAHACRCPAMSRSTAFRRTYPLHAAGRHDGPGARRRDRRRACSIITRAEIEDGALAGKALELAWAADPVDLFFLEIQGSGRIRFPDGSVMRLGYADQNGREYVAIGRLLRDRGILPPGGANMQSIKAWMRAQARPGPRADARESVLHFLQGTDRGRVRSARSTCR